MSRIFITGSADGLGQLAARLLVAEGHQVVLHARNAARAKQALASVPAAANIETQNHYLFACAELSGVKLSKP